MLPEPASLSVFLLAALALLVIPGPAVLYIVARSIDQGRAAGLVSVLGIGAGSMVHVVAAAAGLSSLLVSSAAAYSVVKFAGAAYLIVLGIGRFTGADADLERRGGATRDLRRAFTQGVWVNVLNPKTALFFFAFLPQFVSTDRGSVAAQIVLLGAIFVMMGVVSDGLYALAAGGLGEWLEARPHVMRWQRWFAGTVLVSLGVATAVTGGRK